MCKGSPAADARCSCSGTSTAVCGATSPSSSGPRARSGSRRWCGSASGHVSSCSCPAPGWRPCARAPMQLETLIAPFIGFLVSVLVCAALSRYRGRWALLDIPNDRSLHTGATPRSGGLGILAGLLAGYVVAANVLSLPGQGWVLVALLLTAGVSFADDIWRLPPLLRFLVHLAAAAALVFPGGYAVTAIALPGLDWHAPVWLLETFSVLFIIWMVNLYNFMDGMDGFAGGMACFGFATLALLGALTGSPLYTLAALLVCAAAAGFLPFNFPPAKLFMGDVGSGSLGLLVAVFLLWADRAGLFHL